MGKSRRGGIPAQRSSMYKPSEVRELWSYSGNCKSFERVETEEFKVTRGTLPLCCQEGPATESHVGQAEDFGICDLSTQFVL